MTDPCPKYIHFNQGIRVQIQTSEKAYIVQESMSVSESDSESDSANKPLQCYKFSEG